VSILVIDKPSGPSSFTVCKRVRAMLGMRGQKVGHGGTLDPFASGVLPVCLGEGTKVLPFLLDADKTYEAVVRFGMETDTLDVTGKVVAEHALTGLDAASVVSALADFRGEIEQVPPMYSALKHAGRPLYVYARRGESVERRPRRVTIHALDMLDLVPPDRVRLRVRCSKGTYIRSLAADLGTRLGVGGHLLELRRTAAGPFKIEQAITLEEVGARIAAGRPLPEISEIDALAHLPRLSVDGAQALSLVHGKGMAWAALSPGDAPVRGPACAVLDSAQGPRLIAIVGLETDGSVKILRGFQQAREALGLGSVAERS
jgi:tRNA pseudouridine55 synthase